MPIDANLNIKIFDENYVFGAAFTAGTHCPVHFHMGGSPSSVGDAIIYGINQWMHNTGVSVGKELGKGILNKFGYDTYTPDNNYQPNLGVTRFDSSEIRLSSGLAEQVALGMPIDLLISPFHSSEEVSRIKKAVKELRPHEILMANHGHGVVITTPKIGSMDCRPSVRPQYY